MAKFKLDDKNIIDTDKMINLFTGPNMVGKTFLMKKLYNSLNIFSKYHEALVNHFNDESNATAYKWIVDLQSLINNSAFSSIDLFELAVKSEIEASLFKIFQGIASDDFLNEYLEPVTPNFEINNIVISRSNEKIDNNEITYVNIRFQSNSKWKHVPVGFGFQLDENTIYKILNMLTIRLFDVKYMNMNLHILANEYSNSDMMHFYKKVRSLAMKHSSIKKDISTELDGNFSKITKVFEDEFQFSFVYDDENPHFIWNGNKFGYDNLSSGFKNLAKIMLAFISQNQYRSPFSDNIIIIEEPETHLSLLNQKKLANLFALLASKFGFTFIISTHSDIFWSLVIHYLKKNNIPKSEISKYELSFSQSEDKICIDTLKEDETPATINESMSDIMETLYGKNR